MARIYLRAARLGPASGGKGDGTEHGDAERCDDARQAGKGRFSRKYHDRRAFINGSRFPGLITDDGAVRQSKNPCLVGLSGIVVYESENAFRVVTRENRLKSGCPSRSQRRKGPTFIRQCCPNRTACLGLAFRSMPRPWAGRGMGRRCRMSRTSSLSCMETRCASVLQTERHASLSTKRALSCKKRSRRGIFHPPFFLVTTMFPSYPLLEP